MEPFIPAAWWRHRIMLTLFTLKIRTIKVVTFLLLLLFFRIGCPGTDCLNFLLSCYKNNIFNNCFSYIQINWQAWVRVPTPTKPSQKKGKRNLDSGCTYLKFYWSSTSSYGPNWVLELIETCFETRALGQNNSPSCFFSSDCPRKGPPIALHYYTPLHIRLYVGGNRISIRVTCSGGWYGYE